MSELILIPYVQINGQWTLTDEMLACIWEQLEKEGHVKMFIYDGSIRDSQSFIANCKEGKAHIHFMFTEAGDPAAIGMLNNFGENFAHAHWMTFNCIRGEGSEKAISHSLRYWFHFEKDGEYLFDTLVGIYPDDNKKIDAFAKKSGFTVIGTIPNLLYNYWENKRTGAVFSYIERRSMKWDS